MKHLLLILLVVGTGACKGQTECSKNDFLKALKNNDLKKDKDITVGKDKILINKDFILKDNLSDNDFYTYKYLGSFGKLSNYIVIEKQDYNGSIFFIVDKGNNFKKYDIKGKPYLFKDLIITVNIANTTDNKNVLNLYKISDELVFIKEIDLKENVIVSDIRLLNFQIFIEDINEKYWKINF